MGTVLNRNCGAGMVRTKVKWFAGDQAGIDEAKAAPERAISPVEIARRKLGWFADGATSGRAANAAPANSTIPKTGGGRAASSAQQSAQLAGHSNKFTETLSMLKKNATDAGLSNKELEVLEATFEQSMTTTRQQLTSSQAILDQCE